MTNRFKGLDLIDRVPEELQTQVCDIIQDAVIKTILKKNKCKKTKWLSEEALQIVNKRREAKGKGEKEKGNIYPSEFRIPDNPSGSEDKESACNAGDLGWIPGSGRSPGEGNGSPLQYSCLEDSTDRGAWWVTRGCKESDATERLTLLLFITTQQFLKPTKGDK